MDYYDGIAAVEKDGKWGFVDKEDNLVIPLEYDELYRYHIDSNQVWFFENRINISKGGRWGYINTRGEVIMPFIYDYAHPFEEGFAMVSLDNRDIAIDINGFIIFENKAGYENVRIVNKNIFIVSSSTPYSWGIVDDSENVLVNLTHSESDIEIIKESFLFTAKMLTQYSKGKDLIELDTKMP